MDRRDIDITDDESTKLTVPTEVLHIHLTEHRRVGALGMFISHLVKYRQTDDAVTLAQPHFATSTSTSPSPSPSPPSTRHSAAAGQLGLRSDMLFLSNIDVCTINRE